jgi:sulfatase modifying factor 1
VRGRHHAAAALLVAATGAVGCSLLVDMNGLAGTASAGADAGAETGAAAGDGGSIVALDGASTESGSQADGSSSTCPTTGGAMVDVGGYCIDATEVTNASYAAFLMSKGADTSGQPSFCSWNSSYAPSCASAAKQDDAPVTCVNWCDAYAFCAWAGKRLCGKIGGGPTSAASLTDPSSDQWYRACSHAGDHDYPYGDKYQSGLCNDVNRGLGKPVAVASSNGCQGGYPGIFDMSGNANELEDACDGTTGPNDNCTFRGGAFDDGPPTNSYLPCSSPGTPLARNFTDNTIGFRCCGP